MKLKKQLVEGPKEKRFEWLPASSKEEDVEFKLYRLFLNSDNLTKKNRICQINNEILLYMINKGVIQTKKHFLNK